MRIKSGKTWCAVLAVVLGAAAAGNPASADPALARCRTPDGLCAPANANTRAPAAPANVGTSAPVGAQVRVALLLPLRSARLSAAAEAVRAGFMAGVERDGAGFKVEIVSTGDTNADALDAYARATAGSDIVVGPMLRNAVGALAGGAPANAAIRPTIALTTPDATGSNRLPPWLLVAALSVEAEARQVAEWAAREHPHGRAVVLTGGSAWAQRAAAAFEARWSELGHTGQRVVVPRSGRDAALDDLQARVGIDPPDLFFAALDVAELRAVRAVVGPAVPCYGGGSINPGRAPGTGVSELDGVRIVDLPFVVLPDHPAVAAYPRPLNPLNADQALDMERLYALGIDAFHLTRALTQPSAMPATIDGASGRLELSRDGDKAVLRRREATVVYREGRYEPVDGGR
jgi:outer membrane PBP1 activator LpoA protein